MPKLSVLIPSRNEKYLFPTIRECFAKAEGEVEVVVTLEGYWPDGWKEITSQYPNLHTVHHGEPRGLRAAVNSAAASAISRGAKYLLKLDAHCMLDGGYDARLLADIEPNWIVVPRRKRLNAESWTIQDVGKPDVDYHYLSFPDDPNDFGGKGLNGKVWYERIKERQGKSEYDLDDEMSSQGSAYCLSADYFQELELLDQQAYGPFWNEFQELGLKCWLSGGQVKINKKTWYAHLHKGREYRGEDGKGGRGYHLPEAWLKQGATFTKNWIWNEAWSKQTKPFKWLIEHFWPVPSWPENWEEVLYAERRPRAIQAKAGEIRVLSPQPAVLTESSSLIIHWADYGVPPDQWIDVRERVQSLVKNNSLDIVVNNSTLTPDSNPFRGKKKTLKVVYSYNGGEQVTIQRDEKDWLIIGQAQERPTERASNAAVAAVSALASPESKRALNIIEGVADNFPRTAPALNDYLIRKFSISPQRLRGPMPIELRDFHRNDLAELFAELGFRRGAEIGVAEGKYSEVLLKANPECELLLVDPWHAYSDNPQNKTKEKNEYAYNETVKRTEYYSNVKLDMRYSTDAVRDVENNSLCFAYIDGHHSYPYVMCDIIEWTKRVRSGGIVALDDVYKLDEARWGAGPMEAIYDYTRAMRINPWFLIDAHKSVDAFFVKP